VEDFVLDVMVGPKQCPRPLRLNLPPFTLVGATTHPGGISGPLRDRFGYVGKVCFYSPEELGLIISGAAYANDMVIHSDVALILARASRGTPRVAIRLVERARDIAQSEQNYRITTEIALRAMDLAGIDEQGLDTTDRKVLKLLLQAAAPVGLSTMAASLGEEESTLSDMVEPYLLRMGLIQKLPNGRVITQAGVDALRVPGIEADNG
jgi:Holliday junction DNA helicase RuvB